MEHPRADMRYPHSFVEFQSWFQTDGDCLDYLEWLRWPVGFVCPACAHTGGWRLNDGRFMCGRCGGRKSVTAGTIFERTRTPLLVWFTACWLFVSEKDGISALHLQRTLAIGSYQTAWAILHRLRSLLVEPIGEQLGGRVVVDEANIGGSGRRPSDGRAHSNKTLIGIAIEVLQPKGLGRCRMRPLTDSSAASLHSFVTDFVARGSTIITDSWSGYCGLGQCGYVHQLHCQAVVSGVRPEEPLPEAHRVASLAKRWLLDTHQGTVERAHLASYLNEFTFRFNRFHSHNCGNTFCQVLSLAVMHKPVRYKDLVVEQRSRITPPTEPVANGHPLSQGYSTSDRPWRTPKSSEKS